MQQLHLVGFTADNRGLIFSARKGAKSGGFVVTLDDKVLARVDEMVARREAEEGHGASSRPKSSLSPREIQARLRAGRTIAQVAREAVVEEEWVARWAAPIAAEQAQVIDRAQELTMAKGRVGLSAVPLGESVRWNMADKGIVFTEAGWTGSWDAFHLRSNSWMVRFTYVYRRGTHQAEWEVDTRDAVVTSRNRQATELGYVAPGSRRPKMPRSMLASLDLPSVAPAVPSASSGTGANSAGAAAKTPTARPTPAKKKAPGAKNVAARTTAAKKKWAVIKKAADRKVAADRLAAKKAAVKKAAIAKQEAAQKAAAKQSAAKEAADKRAAKKAAAAKKSPARKSAAKKATARKSAARKAPAKKATARSSRPAAPKKVPRRPTAAKRRPPAPVSAAARSTRPAAEPRRLSARPPTTAPARAADRPRPAQSSSERPARRRPESAERQERRFARADSEREPAAREDESRARTDPQEAPAPPARAPIRIDSGVPRRADTGSSAIIRADRADQSREEPAAVGTRSAENGAPRQGRFRFRRGRSRS